MKDNDKRKRGKQAADKPNQPHKRAVIYARYSSSGQREESIEGQLRDCHVYASQNNMTVIGEYIDKAMTGRSDKRPDLQRMLRDSERGYFDAVISWKMDRLFRNRYDAAIHKAKLKKNGVQLFYAKEAIPEGPAGIFFESVMEGYAEFYSANLSENVKRGFYDSALDMKTLGQTVIGYKKGPDGRFAIDAGQAAVVRRIFEEYAAGERAKDIYARLNAEGHRTSRGGLFNKNSIRRILQNEKYIGVYEYQDIRVEGGIPAIIDRDLFGRVQEMVEKNHASPNQQAQRFLLTGKLKCGCCGEDMTGDGGTSHSGKAYAYYTCNKRKYDKSCNKERAPKDWIENLVIDEIIKLLNTEGFIDSMAKMAVEYQEQERDRSVLDALEVRKKENEKAIANILAAVEAGMFNPSMKSRLTELEAESIKIENGIAREKVETRIVGHKSIAFMLEKFRDADTADETHRARLIKTFINSVYLYDDEDDPMKKGKIVLCMNYTDEHGKISKITLSIMEKAVFNGDGGCSIFEPPPAPPAKSRSKKLDFNVELFKLYSPLNPITAPRPAEKLGTK